MADDDLMQKADALMRRHRVFVAGAAESSAAEAASQEDVPVLTEVVSPGAVLATAPLRQAAADAAALRGALACELENWLDEELPQHVMRVLDGVTDQLISQLSRKARSDLLPRLQGILEAAGTAAKPASTGE